ncbi:hypothetical protein IWW50_000140 [Coemansia erecta]|nr:hypothetical protein GGF43_000188 [Coemansia sp. RSA 2618]KAJ2830645.1 hypothetical protein IWW50_000140 [Coemansia erecta]
MSDDNPSRLAAVRQLFGFGRKAWLAVLALTAFAGVLIVYSYGFLEIELGRTRVVQPAEGPPLPDLSDSSQADADTLQVQRPPRFKLCRELPIPAGYWNLTTADHSAFVDIPQRSDIGVGESVCVRVIVPGQHTQAPMTFVPYPNAPWDSVLLDLVGGNTNVSVPAALQMTEHTHNYFRDRTHIYEADVVLRDADTYHAEGYIEFRQARWNAEAFLDPQPFEPEQLDIPDVKVNVQDDDGLSPYSLKRYPDLPLCTDSDADGRWVAVSTLPFDAALVPPADNHGLVWLPYECRLQRITYTAFAQCLARKYPLVHWFGDSNTRRALKKVSTLGAWCSENPEDIVCTCNDNSEAFANYKTNERTAPFDLDPVAGGAVATSAPSTNASRIVAFKWDGLTTRNSPPWAEYFTSDFTERLGHPKLAVFGMTNWDTAFETRAFFAGEVAKLADVVDSTYPGTDVVLRTGQYYCCTSDMDKFWKRRYSRLRNHYFDQTLVDHFKTKFAGTRNVLVWNVARLSERRPYKLREEDVTKCAANHVRSEIIEIENQVLMNALCNNAMD